MNKTPKHSIRYEGQIANIIRNVAILVLTYLKFLTYGFPKTRISLFVGILNSLVIK